MEWIFGLFLVTGIILIVLELKYESLRGIEIPAAFLFFLTGIFTNEIGSKDVPEAIDVYRGRTTLQITYQDSIPIDSVVVFK